MKYIRCRKAYNGKRTRILLDGTRWKVLEKVEGSVSEVGIWNDTRINWGQNASEAGIIKNYINDDDGYDIIDWGFKHYSSKL